MPVPLRPQQNFTVVRQIANHLDLDTNYVRAVIRNAYTDEIIATLNLEDKGGQRFRKNWQVPADLSGQGYYVSIVTSVYTDSGYTTKNESYGDEENTYLVSDVFGRRSTGGTGGADAFTIRRILKEELDKLPKPEPPEEDIPDPRLDTLLMRLERLETAVSALPTTTPDLSPLLAAIGSAEAAIRAKEVTPGTDLSPIIQRLDRLSPELRAAMGTISTLIEHGQSQIAGGVVSGLSADLVKELEHLFQSIEFKIAPSTAKGELTQKTQEAVPFDLASLAS
jgi:hypothetical protein